jgi:cation transport ATPase
LALFAIAAHLTLGYSSHAPIASYQLPLIAALFGGGLPLVIELAIKPYRRQFGSDLLAGISIVTSVLLGQYLAGTLVVLMLSGGEALETYAVASASSVLRALARRVPFIAHRRSGAQMCDVPLGAVTVADVLVMFPHEICPVDGRVIEGHGVMDESISNLPQLRISTNQA